MSEIEIESEIENQGEELQAPPADPPAKKRVRPGRVAAVAGSVLLAGALVAGVGHTVVTVRDADRDAGAPLWKFPHDKPADTKAATPSGLAGTLVPYGTDGWTRGPDLGEFGSDVALSGAQATALRKESLRDLPRTQRRQVEKQIDKAQITGMAMRSYVSAEATVSIVLSQMENRATVRSSSEFQTEVLDTLGLFRGGPKIKGYKNARCFLSPKGEDEDLDYLFCSAYQGNVLLTATADGVRPLDTNEVALLLGAQLDRIAEPGEAV
ncbi:hypothetical protein [Streptomyces sp. P17]|uniref:hypothetical protein n=1 Tax=Streptomyces sp. P17 TaxID=3074716 RepID=UPI0028F3E37E|nr:hypothetical protein [Streptomyces sp. P17]MDT9698749.1 hypothetical protein [Streptomyces sp. P17]